ncbi:MAG: ribosome recycling factor [Patescibacteria group bacterium]
MQDLQLKLSEIIKHFKEQMAGIRGGRPNPKLIEDIGVEYFGQKLTVKQLGSIGVIPPTTIQISAWDKGAVSAIAKAIESSNLNVSANTEGNLIRINLPPLSSERRQELIKIAKKEAEESKIKIRHSRDEMNKKINLQAEKGEITEDDKFKLKEDIQKAIDKTNEEIEKILENKIKEIEE